MFIRAGTFFLGGFSIIQLSLFEDPVSEAEKVIIPSTVVSPLESKEKITSKKFREQQKLFSQYVHAIQKEKGCTWFEARDLFFEYRDQQKPIFFTIK